MLNGVGCYFKLSFSNIFAGVFEGEIKRTNKMFHHTLTRYWQGWTKGREDYARRQQLVIVTKYHPKPYPYITPTIPYLHTLPKTYGYSEEKGKWCFRKFVASMRPMTSSPNTASGGEERKVKAEANNILGLCATITAGGKLLPFSPCFDLRGTKYDNLMPNLLCYFS